MQRFSCYGCFVIEAKIFRIVKFISKSFLLYYKVMTVAGKHMRKQIFMREITSTKHNINMYLAQADSFSRADTY